MRDSLDDGLRILRRHQKFDHATDHAQALARRARGFGLAIHYHNRRRLHADIETPLESTYWESLDQMLARMDIVSVNCPHTPATFHLLSARRLKLMKTTAIIVNTARGAIIKKSAILAALHESRLAGAGLDVHEQEPLPADHPLRQVRGLVRAVLKDLSGSFSRLYSHEGRPSIPPEQLLSALLLQVFYGIRSERQLMEQLDYNLLYRWFVGLSPDDPVWDPTTFTKNRARLENLIHRVFEPARLNIENTRRPCDSSAICTFSTTVSEAKVAAFSGYGLSIRAPEVTPLTAGERAALRSFVLAPLTLPTIVTGVALLQFYYAIDLDAPMTGLLIGQTLYTTPAEIYRALIEATAFGALRIKLGGGHGGIITRIAFR